MKNLVLKMLRFTIIRRLNRAGYGSQFINDVMKALGLREAGLPKFLNPPPPPRSDRWPFVDTTSNLSKLIKPQPFMSKIDSEPSCANCGRPASEHLFPKYKCP
jgi:hypothetical protein